MDIYNIYNILSYKRSSGSAGELKFIHDLIEPLKLTRDEYGNYYTRIGTAPVLWSCHIDTMHKFNESWDTQTLAVHDGKISANTSSCLGADNGAGMYLLFSMMKAGIEGLYIFHRNEEQGGLGSKFIAQNTPELVSGMQYAIAFDRHGKNSIITHQGYRTCSDKFATSLAKELKRVSGLDFYLDDTGLFTDTANYFEIIPECTNVSAGFMDEHTWYETLDINFLKALRKGLVQIDTKNLVVDRSPSDVLEWSSAWLGFASQNNNLRDNNYYDDLISEHPHVIRSILRTYGILDEVMSDLEQALM
jgi:hypothetical protein